MELTHHNLPSTFDFRLSTFDFRARLMVTLALVKMCKTFHLPERISWKDVRSRVQGVKFVDESRAVMVFEDVGEKTTVMGSIDSPVVRTCTTFFAEKQQQQVQMKQQEQKICRDTSIIRTLMVAVASKGGADVQWAKHPVTEACDYCVFQITTEKALDVFRLQQALSRKIGDKEWFVTMDLELDDALYAVCDQVTWRVSDTVPQRLLASVQGLAPCEARGLVETAWSDLARYFN